MALEQLGNLPFFKFESQVMQIHSVSSALLKPVRLDSTTSGEHTLYLFTSHFTTELLYQSWLQQVHTYSGTCAMFLWEIFIIEIALHLFFVVSAHHCFMLIVTHLAAHEKVFQWLFLLFFWNFYFSDVLRVIQFSYSSGLFVNFSYVLCVLCFSSSCCQFIDFLCDMLWILCFLFSYCLFVNYPYVLWVLSFLFFNRLFVNFPYALWVVCFSFSYGVLIF